MVRRGWEEKEKKRPEAELVVERARKNKFRVWRKGDEGHGRVVVIDQAF